MAETGLRNGKALRVYQIILILVLGWFAGRLPDLLHANEQQKLALGALVRGSETAVSRAAVAPAAAGDARGEADLVARVATEVAERTVAQLLAAGWLPPGQAQIAGRALPPRETIVRVVTEQAPAPQGSGVATGAPGGWAIAPAPPAATAGQAAGAAAPAGGAASGPVLSGAPGGAPGGAATQAFALATAGYAALRDGHRREGVALLERAVATAPKADGAAQWRADAALLRKRWSIAGYVVSRTGVDADALAASPVLGGGQAGVAAGYTLNPLAERRLSVVGRVAAAASSTGAIDGETAEAALGLRLQPFRDIPIAIDAERRFALGYYARNAWAARLSGGDAADLRLAGRAFRLEGYGEAGAVGLKRTALYAGGQLRGGTPLFAFGKVALDGGAGVWGSVQRLDRRNLSRLDLGPSAQLKLAPWPFRAQVDYRVRVAGDALPGSGPVITVAGEF